MKKRKLTSMLILTICTVLLYIVYWQCSFQGELKKKTGKGFGAIGHLFISLITFGIYNIYWQFAAGRRLYSLGTKHNHSGIYLTFFLFYLGIANPFLMQMQANSLKLR